MSQDYPSDWSTRRKEVLKRDRYTCQNCGRKGGEINNIQLHAHHIVPKSNGGTHSKSNLKTLCKDCHNAIHGDTMAPSANIQDIESQNGQESEIGSFTNIDPFESCPICRTTGSFKTTTDSGVGSNNVVAMCVDCQTEFSKNKESEVMFGELLKITKSNYDIEGYKFSPNTLKKIENRGLEDLNELEKYEQESYKFHSRLKYFTISWIIIMLSSTVYAVLLGDFFLLFSSVIILMICGFGVLKYLDMQSVA